jgi:hypothetical protein
MPEPEQHILAEPGFGTAPSGEKVLAGNVRKAPANTTALRERARQHM